MTATMTEAMKRKLLQELEAATFAVNAETVGSRTIMLDASWDLVDTWKLVPVRVREEVSFADAEVEAVSICDDCDDLSESQKEAVGKYERSCVALGLHPILFRVSAGKGVYAINPVWPGARFVREVAGRYRADEGSGYGDCYSFSLLSFHTAEPHTDDVLEYGPRGVMTMFFPLLFAQPPVPDDVPYNPAPNPLSARKMFMSFRNCANSTEINEREMSEIFRETKREFSVFREKFEEYLIQAQELRTGKPVWFNSGTEIHAVALDPRDGLEVEQAPVETCVGFALDVSLDDYFLQ